MDRNLVYSKTASGEEATLQRTRVVQRNLRMVLLQVDGQLNVAGLIEKIGNESLVLNSLRELEKGGFIALTLEAPSVWEQSKAKIKSIKKAATDQVSQISAFEPSKEPLSGHSIPDSNFSGFSRPAPDEPPAKKTAGPVPTPVPAPVPVPPPALEPIRPGPPPPAMSPKEKKAGVGERFSSWLASRRKERAPRELAPAGPSSWPSRIAFGLVLLVVAAVLAILLFPYGSYRAEIEVALTDALGSPVKIGQVDGGFFPQPSLALRDVRVGEREELRAAMVKIPGLLTWRSAGRKPVERVEITGATVQAGFAGRLATMKDHLEQSSRVQLTKIDVKDATLLAGEFSVAGLSGEIAFAKSETPGVLLLQTADSGFRVELHPGDEGGRFIIEAINWKPGEKSPVQFGALTAKGKVTASRAVFESLDMNVLDGSVQGTMTYDWSKGVTSAGDLVLARVSVRKLAQALGVPLEMDGKLAGTLRMRTAAESLAGFLDGTEATMAFQIDQGLLNGVDIGEASRRGPGEGVRGGATKFDRLKGNLTLTSTQLTGANLDMDSGLVKGTGQFVARRDKTVDASLQVSINTSVNSIRTPVRISGTLPILNTTIAR